MTNVVVFSGGRGATTIVSALARARRVNLSVVVNAYDAGLSTGRVRRAVGGILGPSDVRKMASTLARAVPGAHRALADVLESRLGRPGAVPADSEAIARHQFTSVIEGRFEDLHDGLATVVGQLSIEEWWAVRDLLMAFQRHLVCTGDNFAFDDLALGNAALAGLFVTSDFNHAVTGYQALLGLKNQRVLNVSQGEDLWLAARAGDHICPEEGTLVASPPPGPISDLYLLPRPAYQTILAGRDQWFESKSTWTDLARAEVLPALNAEAAEAVATADIIVYGPGTQHSSLFPTYLTRGLGEVVRDNHWAEKILVTNLARDKDQHPDETVAEVLAKFMFFMTRRGEVKASDSELITSVLLSDDDCGPLAGFLGGSIRRRPAAWSSPEGHHLGLAVRDEISSAANRVSRRRSTACGEGVRRRPAAGIVPN